MFNKKNTVIPGQLYVLIGVFFFSLVVPTIKIALEVYPALFIAAARLSVGGLLALLYLASQKQLPLLISEWKTSIAASYTLLGFPVFLSMGLDKLDANYAIVAIGFLPIATALISTWLFKDKTDQTVYWVSAIAGCLILFYSLGGHLSFSLYQGYVLLAIICNATAYSLGARLAQRHGGVKAISLSLIYSLPLSLTLLIIHLPSEAVWTPLTLLEPSFIAIIYNCLFAQFIGFFPFYYGLSRCGTAKGIQVQLLQPFMSLIFAYYLLGDPIQTLDLIMAIAILGLVLMIYFPNLIQVPKNYFKRLITSGPSSTKLE
jgi:drug/metabolite transporter (DMT)-like permease